MAKQDEHGRLIAVAAKAALAPLGCKRVGQSRTWISDQRYWLIVIEFQPSGWAKGSYLNVGAMWPWYARKGLFFHSGYRVADFVPFESRQQFGPLIVGMATKAAEEVLALREKFRSLADIHRFLVNQLTDDDWPVYRAAVAAGLIGDMATSRDLFRRMEEWPTQGYDWQKKLKSDSATLARLLDDPPRFRAAVLSIIEECRALNKLPPDPNCLDTTNSIAARQ